MSDDPRQNQFPYRHGTTIGRAARRINSQSAQGAFPLPIRPGVPLNRRPRHRNRTSGSIEPT
jgi:hypothetical protein